MSDAALVAEVAREVLAAPSLDPWAPLVEGEWIGVAVDPADGGQGGTLEEAAALAEAAGATAAASPVLEAVLAAIVAAGTLAGRELLPRLAAGEERALLVPEVATGGRLPRVRVPWGRDAGVALVVVRDGTRLRLALVPRDELVVEAGATAAGDPADLLTPAEGARLAGDGELDRDALLAATGVLTAARLTGAADAVHAMTVDYARERRQFGKPIASFQAIGHALARQAGAAELARAALRSALPAAVAGEPALPVAARIVAADAAREVAAIAHQLHGAIGVTAEHDLHRFTLRMRAWRDAFGSARRWQAELGAMAVERPASFWDATAPDHAA